MDENKNPNNFSPEIITVPNAHQVMLDEAQITMVEDLQDFVLKTRALTTEKINGQWQSSLPFRQWKSGAATYEAFTDLVSANKTTVLKKFTNDDKSYEMLTFVKDSELDTYSATWSASHDIIVSLGVKITGTEWNASPDRLEWVNQDSGNSASADSMALDPLIHADGTPAPLKEKALEAAHDLTEERVNSLLAEFNQSKKITKRMAGFIGRSAAK